MKQVKEKSMADEKKNVCRNEPCSCPVPDGQKYCSASCEGKGSGIIELDCDCGHPDCSGNF